jgi:hypothetical protein
MYIVEVKRKRQEKSGKMRKIQKEVRRWISRRNTVGGYNAQQNLVSDMT